MSDKILLQKLVITEKSKKRLEAELEETQKLVTILESQLEVSTIKIIQLNKDNKKLKKELRQYDFTENKIDIGKFTVNKINKFLMEPSKKINNIDIRNIIESLNGNHDGKFQYLLNNIFNRNIREKIIDHIHKYYNNEQDFKLEITYNTLQKLIGNTKLLKLQKIFNSNISKIKLRRVIGNNSYIDFHKDYANKTLKVPLNSHKEYKGGDIVYLSNGERHIPKQNLNSMTIHGNDIIHGVSSITDGIRYSLFLLCD